jgi:hypothetical protein
MTGKSVMDDESIDSTLYRRGNFEADNVKINWKNP